jgi:hypothetical protein
MARVPKVAGEMLLARGIHFCPNSFSNKLCYSVKNIYIVKKAVPLHAMVALGGEEVQLLLILDLGTRWG